MPRFFAARKKNRRIRPQKPGFYPWPKSPARAGLRHVVCRSFLQSTNRRILEVHLFDLPRFYPYIFGEVKNAG